MPIKKKCTHPNSHFSFSCVCSMKNPHSSSNWTQTRRIQGLQVPICTISKPVNITIIIFSYHLRIQSLHYEGHSSPFFLSRSTETPTFILLLRRHKISLERDCLVIMFTFSPFISLKLVVFLNPDTCLQSLSSGTQKESPNFPF